MNVLNALANTPGGSGANATGADRCWLRVGGTVAGEGPAPRVAFEHEPTGRTVTVVVSYALAGYWVERDAAGLITALDLPGGRVLERPGVPRVPAAVFSVALPFGAKFDPQAVVIAVDEPIDADEPVRLTPVPLPHLEGTPPVLIPDPTVWASDQWFPLAVAEVGTAPDLDGVRRAVVRVNPLAVVPRSGRLQVRARVLLRVVCAVRNGGRYPDGRVDRLSPLVARLPGATDLLT